MYVAVATTTRIVDAAHIFIVSASGVTWKDEQDKVVTPARTFTAIWGVDGTVLRAVRDEDRHAAPRSSASGKWVLVFRDLVLLCAFYR